MYIGVCVYQGWRNYRKVGGKPTDVFVYLLRRVLKLGGMTPHFCHPCIYMLFAHFVCAFTFMHSLVYVGGFKSYVFPNPFVGK